MRFAVGVAAVLLVCCVSSCTATRSEAEVLAEFNSFITTFNKYYDSAAERADRLRAFRDNLQIIDEHNARTDSSYKLGVTQFADMTNDEFRRGPQASGALRLTSDRTGIPTQSFQMPFADPPTDLDWRSQGVVSEVRDEGACGTTWAWSPVTALESAWAITNKIPVVTFSVQQVSDCETATSYGCNGGDPNGAFNYSIRQGLCLEHDYPNPYAPKNFPCVDSKCTPTGEWRAIVILKNDEKVMQAATARNPINVNLDAGNSVFQLYKSGIIDDPKCTKNVDHCVTAVGYGTENGKDYWIMKNMWGTKWGEAGYVRIVRNKNMCGMTEAKEFPPAYPLV